MGGADRGERLAQAGRAEGEGAGASRVVGSRTIHAGRKFDFEVVALRPTPRSVEATGSDAPVEREMIRHPGAVCVLPIVETEDGPRVVMIRNHRFTVDRELWEIPAGGIDPGEEPAVCAVRELEEETGYAASRVEHLASFLTTPGITDELMHAYAATDLREVGQRLEPDEEITVHLLDPTELVAMVERGEIDDAKTMLVVLLAARRGLLAGV